MWLWVGIQLYKMDLNIVSLQNDLSIFGKVNVLGIWEGLALFLLFLLQPPLDTVSFPLLYFLHSCVGVLSGLPSELASPASAFYSALTDFWFGEGFFG